MRESHACPYDENCARVFTTERGVYPVLKERLFEIFKNYPKIRKTIEIVLSFGCMVTINYSYQQRSDVTLNILSNQLYV